MKKLICLLLFFSLLSCKKEPWNNPDVKHHVTQSTESGKVEYYIVSDITYAENGCITFKYISNYDWGKKETKTLCQYYKVDY